MGSAVSATRSSHTQTGPGRCLLILQALRRHDATAHVVSSHGRWFAAERTLTGAAAAAWLDGSTALPAVVLALPGRVAVDLAALPVADLGKRLKARCADWSAGELAARLTLQLSVAQAVALARNEWLRELACHVLVRRRELVGLRATLASWPSSWVPVFARPLAATTSLLGSEPFAVVSPVLRLCLPAGAAVLPVSVDLLPHWTGTELDCDSLDTALAEIVALADELIDELGWPLASDVWDVYRHRRLALLPRGLGTLAKLAGASDSAPAFVSSVVGRFQRLANRHSLAVAAARGTLPALDPEQSLGHLCHRRDYAEWQRRWTESSRGQGFRHRNLTFVCIADLWPGPSVASGPVMMVGQALGADGTAYGERWPAIARSLGNRSAFGQLAATLTRDSRGSTDIG